MLSLKDEYLREIRALLNQYVPRMEVWAYGSRVKNKSHDGSDLDLVIRNPNQLDQPLANLSQLRSALSESNIPIQVEIVDWATIPTSFQTEIINQHISI